jgi:hypothetical protein
MAHTILRSRFHVRHPGYLILHRDSSFGQQQQTRNWMGDLKAL